MNKPNIVVLGAGYGGLLTTVRLQKLINEKQATITLINKDDTHYESTWLHEVAAGTITDDRCQYPISQVINKKRVQFIQDTVTRIQPDKKRVVLSDSTIPYDYLVVGLGFESETFGIPGLKEHSLSITNVHTASRIRNKLEELFSTYDSEKQPELSLVVGGAGFTGIEFLGELVNQIPVLCKQYNVSEDSVKIYCVEAAPTALPGFDSELVDYVVGHLEEHGVTFKVRTAIKEATEEGIVIAKGEDIETLRADLVVWAAGVRGNHIIDESFESARGKVKVDKSLRVPNCEDVFVIGDCSFVLNEETNRPYPPTAQIAMQQGETTAKNLARLVKEEKELIPFVFDNKGTVCSLGEHNATGTVFGKNISGFPANFMKKVIDNRALFLIGGVPLVMKKGKFNIF